MQAPWDNISLHSVVVNFILAAFGETSDGTDTIAFVEVPSLLRRQWQPPEQTINFDSTKSRGLQTMLQGKLAMALASFNLSSVPVRWQGKIFHPIALPPIPRPIHCPLHHASPPTKVEKVSLPQSRADYPERRLSFRQWPTFIAICASRRSAYSLVTHEKAKAD